MDQLDALGKLILDWASTPDDVWRPSPFHVEGLHGPATRRILAGIDRAKANVDSSPLGIAIQGQRGTGKTHLLGWVRQQVQDAGGYFFLVTLHDGVDFWSSTLHCVLDGLIRVGEGSDSQLKRLLRGLAASVGLPVSLQNAVAGDMRLSPESLDIFVSAFRGRWPQLGADCHDTLRALVLRASSHVDALDVGYTYLQAREETEPGERTLWGIHYADRKPAQWLVRELSRLLALTGPTVIAVDQIDALIAQYGGALVHYDDDNPDVRDDRQMNMIAGGLMDLRECTSRTLCIVACLNPSWILIRKSAVDTAADRFRDVLQLRLIPDAAVGEALIAKRFAACYDEIGFRPPYPTWPVKPSAFVDAPSFTARGLMKRVDEHINACLNSGVVTELEQLEEAEPVPPPVPPPLPSELSTLDKRFNELMRSADVSAALDPDSEDSTMPALISAGLGAWIEERGDDARLYAQDPPPRGKATLHARLRRTLNEELEDELHWAFRAIASSNAIAALTRLRAASGFAGLSHGGTKRRLFILRNAGWAKGPKTRDALEHLHAAGGRTLAVAPEDLAVFDALRRMRDERHPDFAAWLTARRPASGTRLLAEALGDAAPQNGGGDRPRPDPPERRSVVRVPRPGGTHPVPLGVTVDGGLAVAAELESLRKHVAIFAGSGSGKTVLIRRLVEECAVQGVSSIVLDPNNDLARLGDAWPAAPEQWGTGDAAKADQYLAGTDVVIWTPRRWAGRPLSFQPLPDFVSVRDDPDELAAAVDAAVATLAPKARVDGNTVKAERGQAVLREALEHFARRGRGGLDSFVELLGDLPDGVSSLAMANKLGADMSQTLTAAMVNDPLFGGAGTPVDPGVLLTPPPGRTARVSVISLVGLPSDEQRQSFVNQLQMALFAWIKRHPAGDRPLGGLFVMDEAQTLAPSGAMTACTQSTIALASQARKYGLGLVFATQAPKGLHNRIPGNAATQFFGFLNSNVQIDAAKEMAQAKGSAVPDISRLRAGQFYVAAEGREFSKVQTSMCLSYHPRSPLSVEEVIERAQKAG